MSWLPRLRRVVAILSAVVAGFILIQGTASSSQTPVDEHQDTQQATPQSSYLELSVEPPVAFAGTLVTLTITYHNLGMPYTVINIDPPGLVAFDPPLSMPCKYYEHPTGCRVLPLQTLSSGVVQITAGATGEVYDEACHCFRWGGGTDNGPAVLTILEKGWQIFLPFLQLRGGQP